MDVLLYFRLDDTKVWGGKNRSRLLINYFRLYSFVNVYKRLEKSLKPLNHE